MNILTVLPFRLLIVLFVLQILSGCANAKLNLDLSIYKGDLNNTEILTQNSLTTVCDYLSVAKKNVNKVAQSRENLADKLYDVYRLSVYARVSEANNKKKKAHQESIKQINSDVDEYLKSLSKLKQKYSVHLDQMAYKSQRLIALAQSSAESLKKVLPETVSEIDFSHPSSLASTAKKRALRQELKLALGDVARSIAQLIELNDTPYQQALEKRWPKVVARLTSSQGKSDLSNTNYKKIAKALKDAANDLKSTQSEIVRIRQSMATKLEIAKDNSDISKVAKALVGSPYQVNEKFISMQNQATDSLNSQLERMQDSGSLVWRIVTDPSNKSNWNKQFSRTYFYAEGNSDVVIVRDSPMDYRIQEGSNNPEALVKAQLGVTRAIADAAIQIAGATTGNPLSVASPGLDKIKKMDNPNFQSDGEALTRKKATLERQSQLRRLAIQAMTMNLRSKLEQLIKSGADVQAITDEIITSLEARKEYFEMGQGGTQ